MNNLNCASLLLNFCHKFKVFSVGWDYLVR